MGPFQTPPQSDASPLIFRLTARARVERDGRRVFPLPLPGPSPAAPVLRLQVPEAVSPVLRLAVLADGRWRESRLSAAVRGLSTTDLALPAVPQELALRWQGDVAPAVVPPEELPGVLVALVPVGRPLPGTPLRLPDFIGIGAMRTGSSFLNRTLGQHPDIWLPAIKELHFFNRHYLPPDAPSWRMRTGLEERRQQALTDARRHGRAQSVEFFERYFSLGPRERDWLWYAALFPAIPPRRLVGEITPAYATLEPTAIDLLVARMPDLKVLYCLRDPVERAWSQVLHHCERTSRRVEEHGEEELLRLVSRPSNRRNGQYCENLDAWRQRLAPGHLHLEFFDDLREDWRAVLERVQTFLGVPPDGDAATPFVSTMAKGRSRGLPPPPRVAARLTELHAPELERLRQRFGNRVAHWGRPWG